METRAANREGLYVCSKAIASAAKRREKAASKEAAAPASAAEPKPPKAKKQKALAAAEGGASASKTAEPSNEEAMAALSLETAAAAEPHSTSTGKKRKKDGKRAAATKDAATLAPAAEPVHRDMQDGNGDYSTPVGSPRPDTQRKSVRFSLKRNLVMTIGQPPLPEDVRTPPMAKPKGSALKQTGALAKNGTPLVTKAAKKAASAVSAKSAARTLDVRGTRSATKARSELNGGGTGRGLPIPDSVPRPKAAEFF